MSYIGTPFVDNTRLFTGTITTTGAGSAIDVTSFDTALIQLNGSTFSGIVTIERSIDGTTWYPCLVTEMNAMNQKTQIDSLGIYAVRSEAQYLRYNVTNISGSLSLIISGGQSIVSPIDKISWAMDETNNTPLNVKLQAQNSGIKQDLSGAFILSDAPQPVTVNQVIGGTTVIDTQGYQTISFTSGTGFVGTVSCSNDGVTFNNILGYNISTAVAATSIPAVSNVIFPCLTRFIRVTSTTAGQFTYYLRNQPFTNNQVNLQQIGGAAVSQASSQLGVNIVNYGGTGVITGGVAGVPSAGGPNAVATATTTNPLQMGGIDPQGLVRRLASDTLGSLFVSARVIPTSLAALGGTTQAPVPVALTGFNNQVPLAVQDTSQFEGQTQTELLAQILQELKILNQQIYELPRVQMAAFNGSPVAVPAQSAALGDEPTAMRNDASLFGQQQ